MENKTGAFIAQLRKENNLTQKEKKYKKMENTMFTIFHF